MKIRSLVLWRLLIPAANSFLDVISLFVRFHLFAVEILTKQQQKEKDYHFMVQIYPLGNYVHLSNFKRRKCRQDRNSPG